MGNQARDWEGLIMHDTPLTLRDALFAIALGLALGALVAFGI
jgi:hypothetical protein